MYVCLCFCGLNFMKTNVGVMGISKNKREMLNSCFLSVSVIILTFSAIFVSSSKPQDPDDIGTNFFLKASKSVPRIGRRTVDYENYFLKASKSIPRIGRRMAHAEGENNDESWFWKTYQDPLKRNFFEKYFKGNEQPGWTDLEKIYKEYPGAFQPEESYPESGTIPAPEPYWKRIKKEEEVDEESVKEEPQPQN